MYFRKGGMKRRTLIEIVSNGDDKGRAEILSLSCHSLRYQCLILSAISTPVTNLQARLFHAMFGLWQFFKVVNSILPIKIFAVSILAACQCDSNLNLMIYGCACDLLCCIQSLAWWKSLTTKKWRLRSLAASLTATNEAIAEKTNSPARNAKIVTIE